MADLDSDIGVSDYSGESSNETPAHCRFNRSYAATVAVARYIRCHGHMTARGLGLSATSSTSGRCRPANVTLTVQGKDVTGQAKFDVDAANISGTVREDGTFGATIGFQHLTGQFVQDQFKGTFKNGDCVWSLLLKRTKQ